MNYDEYQMALFDRIEAIKATDGKYDLLNNSYISFSGGKDSTVLHHLIDLALPNNRIPRVFIDTGIEYLEIAKFVRNLASKDDRFVIIKPSKPIRETLERYGYPFKSKEHSHHLSIYQHSGMGKSVDKYLNSNKMVKCPKSLRYQFSPEFKIKVSDLCCKKLKKEPALKWQKEHGKPIAITGMMKAEGGERRTIGCIVTSKDGNISKFHPLATITKEFEEEFIKRNEIALCVLYAPPFNFKRTGCKGCPFSLDLQDQLTTMETYLPNERKQCESIWKTVYEEYRRIGYRLKEDEQLTLF